MKRTPLKRSTKRINPIGKRGRANIAARRIISEIGAFLNITECEIKLEGCMRTFGLAPAHKHKRDWYNGDVEKLSDPKEWVGACQHCHDKIEVSRTLTEEVFNKLRPTI